MTVKNMRERIVIPGTTFRNVCEENVIPGTTIRKLRTEKTNAGTDMKVCNVLHDIGNMRNKILVRSCNDFA